MEFNKAFRILIATIFGMSFLFYMANPLYARVVNKVDIFTRNAGYEIRVNFILPLRYVKHRPQKKGKNLLVELSPVSGITLENAEIRKHFEDREPLSWDRSVPAPLSAMTFDAESPDRPKLVLRFSKEVEFSLKSSGDLRTLIIFLKAAIETGEIDKTDKNESSIKVPNISQANPKLVKTMDEARKEMTAGNYSRAIQLYTKILMRPESGFSREAQELLGLARDRNNQGAHAQSEYKKYLEKYPDGPGAERVRQRLNGLLTAHDKPKDKLRKSKASSDPDSLNWDTQFFGSLSQFFNHGKTDFQENGQPRTNRSDINSNIDLNVRSRSEKYQIRSQFVGGYDLDLREDGDRSEGSVNTLVVEGKDVERGLSGRFGRQFESTGGILGRFDGGLVSYEISPEVQVNGVFGFPVQFTTSDPVRTEKQFYGLNFDLGTFAEFWNFNVFGIHQQADGITDRQALGGEVRYFHPQRSFLGLVDFDVSHTELNLLIFSGDYVFPEKTRWHLALDYRKSPLLTTSNALQGQPGVKDISGLLTLFSEDEIRGLARDRTATNKSLIFSVTQELNEQFQLNGEFSVSELSGTPASGGVPESQSTGAEFFYSTQLISSSLFFDNDIVILGARFSDLQNVESYSGDLNMRFQITRNLRINPRIRLNHRINKRSNGERTNLRPLVRLDYRWKKWIRFEMEAGREWISESVLGDSLQSRNYFLTVGARVFF